MSLSRYTFEGVYRFQGCNGRHSNDQVWKDSRRNEAKQAQMQLTDSFGQHIGRGRFNLSGKLRAAALEVTGITDLFGA
jgi:hypothetical protein